MNQVYSKRRADFARKLSENNNKVREAEENGKNHEVS
jgi:hypothetical protein